MTPATGTSLLVVVRELESVADRLERSSWLNMVIDLNELKDNANLDAILDKNLNDILDDILNKSNRDSNRDGSTPITAVTNDRLAINTAWLLLLLMLSIYFHPKTYVI